MSAADIAADVLRRCTEQRAWLTACEAADPPYARWTPGGANPEPFPTIHGLDEALAARAA